MVLSLMEAMYKFILKNFPSVYKLCENDVLGLPLEILADILHDDKLNVPDEGLLWRVIKSWIDVDPAERVRNLPDLLPTCRLGLLSREYFSENVSDTLNFL